MKAVEVFKACISFMVTVFLLLLVTETAYADWSIDVESGLAFSGYNDVRIPGKTGSDISLSKYLEAESTELVRQRYINHFCAWQVPPPARRTGGSLFEVDCPA
jgi:hypothetical protein